MSCIFNKTMELTYKYDLTTTKKYFENEIQLSRCCLLFPEWFISYEDLIKKENIYSYITNLSNPTIKK